MTELSLHILDVVQNSLSAGATRIIIRIEEIPVDDLYRIEISDNGKGMKRDELAKVTDPFYTSRTTRKVGMGIPLFMQAVEQCNGELSLASEPGKGLQVKASLQLSHFDRQPLGDIAGVVMQLVNSYTSAEFRYEHTTPNGSWAFDTVEVKEIVGAENIPEPNVIRFLRQMIRENLEDIKAGA